MEALVADDTHDRRSMEIGLMTEPQAGGTYDDLLALARWAEAYGLDAFARSDHYLETEVSAPTTDAFATMAGLARDTERIPLVVLVSPLTFRHPAVLAKTAATIDQMAGGRFALGVGTGWMESEHCAFGIEFYDRRERFLRLAEVLGYLRAAFHGGAYSGEYYTLEDICVLPRPSAGFEIIVGGAGLKKTPALAGRFADEYNFLAADTETMRARIAAMRESASSEGRNPDTIRISAMAWMVVASDERSYRELLEKRGAVRGIDADAYEAQLKRADVPCGTPDDLAAHMSDIAGLGVDRVYIEVLEPLAEVDTEGLELIVDVIRSI